MSYPQFVESVMNLYFKRILLPVIILVFPVLLVAQNYQIDNKTAYASTSFSQEIAEFQIVIDSLMSAQNIPGIQIAVSVNNELVWSQGFGYSDVENKVALWPYTKMRIGSVSKTLTSYALGQLIQEGLLNEELPVQNYVPYFPLKKHAINTRQVAGHLAGFRHYRGNEFYINENYRSVKEGIEYFMDDTLLYKPGDHYNYSSWGWNLISAVIEGASQIGFLEYMQNNVFNLIGMNGTYADKFEDIIPNRTHYYELDKSGSIKNAPFVDNSIKWAGGGFLSTAEDLLKFGNYIMFESNFSHETLDKLWKSQKTSAGELTNYGMGWRSGKFDGMDWVGHSGGSVGGTTQFMVFPDYNLVLAIISNMSGVKYNHIHLRIAKSFITK